MKKNILFILFLLSMKLSFGQGELLWVKKIKGGNEIAISNFLAYQSNTQYVFPMSRIRLDKDDQNIYYKRQKIFNSFLIIDELKPILVELFNKEIIVITQRKLHEDFPHKVKRYKCIIIDTKFIDSYYVVEFETPIYLLWSNTFLNSGSLENTYVISGINFDELDITIKEVSKNVNEVKLPLERFKNPCLE